MKSDLDRMFERYVLHSYLYYHLDASVISDAQFDAMCQKLEQEWDNITHPERDSLASRDDMKATTGYQMHGKWPEWVVRRAKACGHC